MLNLTFDFRQLPDREAFYAALVRQSHCPFAFGNNLDALWDWLTGGMALPATLHLRHVDESNVEFAPVLALLEEAVAQLEGELRLVRD
ncbi:MAG: barstar family protein [Pantoea sp.]|uniref:Barstar family protein n=1 Tax=Pantoea phytobeneficialis TaxID=2052056 RepID=A0AAP9KR66_9GAMM|nr:MULTISPECIES: barstar family protein [Pantoea]MDO6406074.1 barstar family protein [Pantoea phytobeneficialis]QGR08710.1 Barstar, RNAse (barnase) inhibitor [Pantoea phytobeneficialis]